MSIMSYGTERNGHGLLFPFISFLLFSHPLLSTNDGTGLLLTSYCNFYSCGSSLDSATVIPLQEAFAVFVHFHAVCLYPTRTCLIRDMMSALFEGAEEEGNAAGICR